MLDRAKGNIEESVLPPLSCPVLTYMHPLPLTTSPPYIYPLFTHHHPVMELEGMLDRAKGNIEESVLRTKSDRADKDIRLQLTESEVERFKNLCNSKDIRMDELEKLHQEDRFKIIGFKVLSLPHKLCLSYPIYSNSTSITSILMNSILSIHYTTRHYSYRFLTLLFTNLPY